jgi:hypothetical protein
MAARAVSNHPTPVAVPSRAHARSRSASMDAYAASRAKTAAAIAQLNTSAQRSRHFSLGSRVFVYPRALPFDPVQEEPLHHNSLFFQLASYYEKMVALDPFRTQVAREKYVQEHQEEETDISENLEAKARGYAVSFVNDNPETFADAVNKIRIKEAWADETLQWQKHRLVLQDLQEDPFDSN